MVSQICDRTTVSGKPIQDNNKKTSNPYLTGILVYCWLLSLDSPHDTHKRRQGRKHFHVMTDDISENIFIDSVIHVVVKTTY